MYGLPVTIYKLFKYLFKTLLYIQVIIFHSFNEKIFSKGSPYTLQTKELLQVSMLSSNKGDLEGCSIYFSGVAFHTEIYTQGKKKPHGVKIMLGNLSHL